MLIFQYTLLAFVKHELLILYSNPRLHQITVGVEHVNWTNSKKLVLVGDGNVGKTCLISAYVKREFPKEDTPCLKVIVMILYTNS